MMLTDNVVEITLHQIALDKKREITTFQKLNEKFEHGKAMQAALNRHFDTKVKFARLMGVLNQEQADSLNTLHEFRNEVYHIGVQHHDVLPALSRFHFEIACDFLAEYEPQGLSWGSNTKIPDRAKKYFAGAKEGGPGSFYNLGSIEEYQEGCTALGNSAEFDPADLIQDLSDHMALEIEAQDCALESAAKDGPFPTSRDQAVIDCQAWPFAFTEEGRNYPKPVGWSGSVLDHVTYIAENHKWDYYQDPIPSWQRRLENLRSEDNPHAALRKYRNFMDQTEKIREALLEAARQVDAYIEEQIDRMRGK